MKIKNYLFLLGTAMAVMSSSAFADTTGTQTFTANVTANTCTIANLQQHVDLGSVQKADYEVPGWQSPASSPVVRVSFDVTGCGNNVTKVNVTPTFNSDAQVTRMVANSGTATGVYFDTGKVANNNFDPKRLWSPGIPREFTLTNGAVQVPVTGVLSSGSTGDTTTGTLDFRMTFAFDFV
ncbi:type 1 fimbrial protein [Salmonella enterica]|nr:type 1 fimbrial protein [Salmonella enterica]